MNKISTQILDFTLLRGKESAADHEHLVWWSNKTNEEPHMLTLSTEEIENTLIMAVFAFSGVDSIVGAAGIFIPRTHNNSEPILNGKKVVEIGTNYVVPSYRNHGIGTMLIEERTKYSLNKDWIPVTVSSNPIVHKALTKLNWQIMDDKDHLQDLRQHLCLKCPNESTCKCCPNMARSGWIFG